MVVSQASPRAQFGLILPSTNTVVEAEFNWMLVPEVSWHSSRIMIHNPTLSNDEEFVKFLDSLRTEITAAVKSVITAKVSYLVMGMSAETFWGGRDGATKFSEWMHELSNGLDVTTGAAACKMALDCYGAKRIGVITPYQPVGDQQVMDFFTQMDYEVVRLEGLKCASATSIANVTKEEIKAAFRRVDGPDVDLLIQAGTNLCAAKAAAELEEELGKPVLAINTCTVWHAYRTNGIKDQIEGFGSLLAKY